MYRHELLGFFYLLGHVYKYFFIQGIIGKLNFNIMLNSLKIYRSSVIENTFSDSSITPQDIVKDTSYIYKEKNTEDLKESIVQIGNAHVSRNDIKNMSERTDDYIQVTSYSNTAYTFKLSKIKMLHTSINSWLKQ